MFQKYKNQVEENTRFVSEILTAQDPVDTDDSEHTACDGSQDT